MHMPHSDRDLIQPWIYTYIICILCASIKMSRLWVCTKRKKSIYYTMCGIICLQRTINVSMPWMGFVTSGRSLALKLTAPIPRFNRCDFVVPRITRRTAYMGVTHQALDPAYQRCPCMHLLCVLWHYCREPGSRFYLLPMYLNVGKSSRIFRTSALSAPSRALLVRVVITAFVYARKTLLFVSYI